MRSIFTLDLLHQTNLIPSLIQYQDRYIYQIDSDFQKRKMVHFIILWKLTEQGIRTVNDSAKRSETFKNSIEKAGGKLVSTYYTLGQYDGVSIVRLLMMQQLCQVYYHMKANRAVLRL